MLIFSPVCFYWLATKFDSKQIDFIFFDPWSFDQLENVNPIQQNDAMLHQLVQHIGVKNLQFSHEGWSHISNAQ